MPICRVIHWYCHFEQYNGIWGALTDYSTGSYCLPGALLGVWLAALIVKKLALSAALPVCWTLSPRGRLSRSHSSA